MVVKGRYPPPFTRIIEIFLFKFTSNFEEGRRLKVFGLSSANRYVIVVRWSFFMFKKNIILDFIKVSLILMIKCGLSDYRIMD